MDYNFVLSGVPNCGKTTLWNLVTGKSSRIGNWPGVTTEKLSARIKSMPDIILTDLPGIYSLNTQSLEEKAAASYLLNENPDALIIIIDGTKPEQSLYLSLELLSLGIPSVIGINFSDELKKNGVSVDCKNLSTKLGVPVFMISAKKKENVSNLLNAAKEIACTPKSRTFPKLSQYDRHQKAEELSTQCFTKSHKKAPPRFLNIFNILSAFSVLVFLFCFQRTVLNNLLPVLFENLTFLICAILAHFHVSPLILSLFSDGIISGISLLFGFLPELFIVFLLSSFLEESGLMGRFAFAFDFMLKKIGLSGKSTLPLFLGFGCTVSGICSAKSSGCSDCSKSTVSALMFIPCSARLPLLLLFCKTFFPQYGIMTVFLFYFIAIITGIVFHLLFSKRIRSPFMLELTPIRFPSVLVLIKSSFRRLISFFKKAGAAVVLSSVLIWFLRSFSFSLVPVYFESESMLFSIGNTLAPVFSLAGIPKEGTIPLLCGFFSKEAALSALVSAVPDISSVFSVLSAFSFLLFYMLYGPCIAGIAVASKELGIKNAIFIFFRQFFIAFFVSSFFYQLSVLIKNIFIR